MAWGCQRLSKVSGNGFLAVGQTQLTQIAQVVHHLACAHDGVPHVPVLSARVHIAMPLSHLKGARALPNLAAETGLPSPGSET